MQIGCKLLIDSKKRYEQRPDNPNKAYFDLFLIKTENLEFIEILTNCKLANTIILLGINCIQIYY